MRDEQASEQKKTAKLRNTTTNQKCEEQWNPFVNHIENYETAHADQQQQQPPIGNRATHSKSICVPSQKAVNDWTSTNISEANNKQFHSSTISIDCWQRTHNANFLQVRIDLFLLE